MSTIEQRSPTGVRKPATTAISAIAGVEMWERFSYYGMQAILVYYLYTTATEGGLGLEKSEATALVGAYGALVYLFTYCGGWISDRLFGAERTLLTGACMVMAGHIMLSLVPGHLGLGLGLLPIALGSALVKTAAITVLGIVFSANDGKRDSAFQIFYMGINIGALGGPIITGWLAQQYGWHAGFIAAAALMALGLALYFALRRPMLALLNPTDRIKVTTAPGHLGKQALPYVLGGTALLALAIAAVATGAVSFGALATVLLVVTVLLALSLFVEILRSPLVTPAENAKVRAFVPMFIASTMYWAIFAQNYGVLAVYSDERLNRMIGGFEMPASWTQSFNPFYILTLSLPLALLWAKLGDRVPKRRTLMSSGLILAGSSMFLLLPFVGGGANSTPVLVLAACVLAMTSGELLIGPIGMAASSAHAPAAFATRFSALYFLSMAIGTSLAGSISRFYDPSNSRAELSYLLAVGGVTVAVGAVLLITGRRR